MRHITPILLVTLIFTILLPGCGLKSMEPSSASSSSEADSLTESTLSSPDTDNDPDQEEENDRISEAISAYAHFLEGDIEGIGDNILTGEVEKKYALIHLDADEIPELVIPLGNAHPMEVAFYAYDGSTVKKVFSTGTFGSAFYEKGTGFVFGFHSEQGSTITKAGVIEAGMLSESIGIMITNLALTGMDVPWEYTFNLFDRKAGDELTKEEYDALLEPFLPANHNYRRLGYDELPALDEGSDLEAALRAALDDEDALPVVGDDDVLSGMIVYEEEGE